MIKFTLSGITVLWIQDARRLQLDQILHSEQTMGNFYRFARVILLRFVVLRQTVPALGYFDSSRPPPPFKVTQSYRKRHGSIRHL